ncbi:outer membrane protein assembly factor BamB family protein [Haloarcula argentinensis]|uniref:outer membrane protein assembly factor BamB family protein n=1 Tax=Haloarcula argentinensis TaxID=43776 RepID=UPI000A8EA51F|nr:hypothetical protein [Haloarcula argentinensis]
MRRKLTVLLLLSSLAVATLGGTAVAHHASGPHSDNWEWIVTVEDGHPALITDSPVSDSIYALFEMYNPDDRSMYETDSVRVYKISETGDVLWNKEIEVGDRYRKARISEITRQNITIHLADFSHHDKNVQISSSGDWVTPPDRQAPLIAGYEIDSISNNSIKKRNKRGEVVWSQKFEEIGYTETLDDGSILTRISEYDTDREKIIQINANGTVAWSLKFDDVQDVQVLSDDTAVAVVGGLDSEHRVVRIGTDGRVAWSQEFNEVHDAQVLPDESTVAVVEGLDSEHKLVRIGTDGTVVWSRTVKLGEPIDPDLDRWNGLLIVETDYTDNVGGVILSTEGDILQEFSRRVTVEKRTTEYVFLQVGDSVTKVNAQGDIIWETPAQTRYTDVRSGEEYTYIMGEPTSSTPTAENTTRLIVLDSESGEKVFHRQLTHPDIGSFSGHMTRTSDGGIIYSEHYFGVVKIDSSGEVDWFVSEDDEATFDAEYNDSVSMSSIPQHRNGTLDGREAYTQTLRISETPEYYLVFSGGDIVAIGKDGEPIITDEGGLYRGVVDIREGYITDQGLIYTTREGVGQLAEPSPNPSTKEDLVDLLPQLTARSDNNDTTPVVSGPNKNASNINVSQSQPGSEPSTNRIFGFLTRNFVLQGLLTVCVVVVTVLLVKGWGDKDNDDKL